MSLFALPQFTFATSRMQMIETMEGGEVIGELGDVPSEFLARKATCDPVSQELNFYCMTKCESATNSKITRTIAHTK